MLHEEKIRFPCPRCAKPVSVARHHAGKRGRCPGCDSIVAIPAAPAEVAAAEPPVGAARPLSGISKVVIFTTDLGAARFARLSGSIIQRTPPRTMIPTADAQLGLNGALLAYMEGHALEFEDAPEMDSNEWQQFLNCRFPGQEWDRWFGKTTSTMYSVVVVRENKAPSTTSHVSGTVSVFEVFGKDRPPSESQAGAVCKKWVQDHPGVNAAAARVRVNVDNSGLWTDNYAREFYPMIHPEYRGRKYLWHSLGVGSQEFWLLVVF